jgi:hypothetical protein
MTGAAAAEPVETRTRLPARASGSHGDSSVTVAVAVSRRRSTEVRKYYGTVPATLRRGSLPACKSVSHGDWQKHFVATVLQWGRQQ